MFPPICIEIKLQNIRESINSSVQDNISKTAFCGPSFSFLSKSATNSRECKFTDLKTKFRWEKLKFFLYKKLDRAAEKLDNKCYIS